LRIEGAVTLAIDGSLVAVGSDKIELAPGATLDLYVAGSVETAGNVQLGDNDPSAFRLYVGGGSDGKDHMLVHAGEQTFRGLIYAPSATVAFAGVTVVEGSIFASDLDYAGTLTVGYAGVRSDGPCDHGSSSSSSGSGPVTEGNLSPK
jgi:hypothetical protein